MEQELVRWLRERLAPHEHLRLGLGDDAAVLRTKAGPDCVVSCDMLMDGVDFRLGECDPRRVGRKSLAVNLSDLASMAARPLAAVVALALPEDSAYELAVALYEGLLPLAEQFQCPVAGGDTNCWNGPLAISITVLGTAPRGIWPRAGAKVGDEILVTGQFGGSLLGRHFDFAPRLREADYLSRHHEIHACIDVSDGLSLDVACLAAESGCGAELDLEAIPIAEDARRMARQDGRSPLDHALSDGEDFELVLAVPLQEARRLLEQQPLPTPLTRIGRFVKPPGLWQAAGQAGARPLTARGYQHGGGHRGGPSGS